jgi:hypothetical protein
LRNVSWPKIPLALLVATLNAAPPEVIATIFAYLVVSAFTVVA